jgi:hypothetical protein
LSAELRLDEGLSWQWPPLESLMKSVLATLLIALLALGGERALAQGNLSGYQKAITYLDVDNERHVWVFTETLDGRMVSKHFDGASWVWMNHGKPPGSTLVANSQPVTYQDANGNRRIYVFAVDNHGELVVRYYKSALSGWQWAKQGGPSLFGATLSAITFVDDDGVRHISAFAIRRLDGGPPPYRAVTNHWNGSTWEWTALFDVATSHAAPSFTTVNTYIDFQGHRRVRVYSPPPRRRLHPTSWTTRGTGADSRWCATPTATTSFSIAV